MRERVCSLAETVGNKRKKRDHIGRVQGSKLSQPGTRQGWQCEMVLKTEIADLGISKRKTKCWTKKLEIVVQKCYDKWLFDISLFSRVSFITFCLKQDGLFVWAVNLFTCISLFLLFLYFVKVWVSQFSCLSTFCFWLAILNMLFFTFSKKVKPIFIMQPN